MWSSPRDVELAQSRLKRDASLGERITGHMCSVGMRAEPSYSKLTDNLIPRIRSISPPCYRVSHDGRVSGTLYRIAVVINASGARCSLTDGLFIRDHWLGVDAFI
jgi:hypothetical protein